MSLPIIDMVEKRFGKLVIISQAQNDINNNIRWNCKCDCGETKVIQGAPLRHNRVKSCGCLTAESARKRATGRIKSKHISWKGYGDISGEHFTKVKYNAIKRNIPFDVTIKDMWTQFLKQNRICALSGIPLQFNSRQGMFDGNASLDRIDSSKGYTIDNIQWIDKNLQHVKGNMLEIDLFKWVKLIYDYHHLVNK